MAISDVLGQDGATGTVTRALASGRVHHAYRFEGPEGVGKEKLALELARALVCSAPRSDGQACEACDACRRATAFSEDPPVPRHPDVVLVAKNLYSPESLGRKREETADISVDQVRKVVLSRLAFPPHEGRGRVVIVRAAEELSVSAANAFLKTLEEPPAGTHFVLLTSRPLELLDTIRSRTQAVRFAPLGDATLARVLAGLGVAEAEIARVLPLADGSVGRALELASSGEALSFAEAFAEAAMAAIGSRDVREALAVAGGKEAKRDDLRGRLVALAARVASAAKGAPPAEQRVWSSRHGLVVEVLRDLERNPAAALAVEGLLLRMRAVR